MITLPAGLGYFPPALFSPLFGVKNKKHPQPHKQKVLNPSHFSSDSYVKTVGP